MINKDGFFVSEKDDLAPNKIALDFRDRYARPCLKEYAETCKNKKLAEAIFVGLYNTRNLVKEPD